jgi:hypothetical protein
VLCARGVLSGLVRHSCVVGECYFVVEPIGGAEAFGAGACTTCREPGPTTAQEARPIDKTQVASEISGRVRDINIS